MNNKINVLSIEQKEEIKRLRKKLMISDFVLVGKLLEITPDNARIRFQRGKQDVFDCVNKIIANRDELIAQYETAKNV